MSMSRGKEMATVSYGNDIATSGGFELIGGSGITIMAPGNGKMHLRYVEEAPLWVVDIADQRSEIVTITAETTVRLRAPSIKTALPLGMRRPAARLG